MALETKVGLLVGLAFIVCFGIILTHRGTGDRLSSDVALELLSRHHAASIVPQSFSFGSFYKRKESKPPTANPRWSPSVNRVIQAEPQAPHDLEHFEIEVAEVDAAAVPAGRSVKQPTWERLFPDNQGGVDARVDERVIEPAPATEKNERRNRIRRSMEKPLRRAASSSYVVKSGDTMWSIARNKYGKGSRTIVDAIFAANRGRLRSADRLIVGVELALPVME